MSLRYKETECPNKLTATTCPILRESPDCDNMIPPPVCPGALPVLRICNSNGIEDDFFQIYIDNTYICDFNILGSLLRELRIMPASAVSKTVTDAIGSVCNVFTDVYTSVLDSLATGAHSLEMRYVSANCCGSFGTVNMVCSTQTISSITFNSTGASFTYSGSHAQAFTFQT